MEDEKNSPLPFLYLNTLALPIIKNFPEIR